MNDDNFTRDQTFAIAALFQSIGKNQREWSAVRKQKDSLAALAGIAHAEECFVRFKDEAYEQMEGNMSYISRKLQEQIDLFLLSEVTEPIIEPDPQSK